MSPDRWARVSDLFDRAADLDPADRPAFLDAHAAGPDGRPDAALREEVERLLALDARTGGWGDGWGEPPPAAPPPEAGPWRLETLVGRGGMGEVWRATRPVGADGLRQTAAVKLVRPGLGDDVAERFRAERRILAGLDHPAIARFLDGGRAGDGRPYLATEFVDGEPVTDYCDRRRLGVNERLALFVGVCEAVAFAHARLVVHRDLKPSNVLVAADGARVKLLDFGIAKLLGDDDGLRTRTGRPVLTPAYAAPEQAGGGPVTTATDVYGLGVLLYELLAGARPRPGGDVTRPSEAVTTAGPTGGRVPPAGAAADAAAGPGGTAALRATTAERLRRRLRGDLDRICLKALRADPERRYRGAAELGADVRRHLDGLPVEARPESAAYAAGKFVRRNRALVAVAAVALVAVLGGAGAALWQAAEAGRQRDLAVAEAAKADGVTDLLLRTLASGDPLAPGYDAELSDTLTVRAALERGLVTVGDLDTPPDVRAAVLATLGDVYLSLGLTETADSLLSRAVAGGRAAYPPGDARLAEPLTNLVWLYTQAGAFGRARPLADEAVAVAGSPTDLAGALAARAMLRHQEVGADSSALADMRRAAAAVRQSPDSLAMAAVAHDHAILLDETGDRRGALRQARFAYDVQRRALVPDHSVVASSLNSLAYLNHVSGNWRQAEALYRQSLALQERVHGRSGLQYAAPLNNLAGLLSGNGRPAEAEAMYTEVLSVLDGQFGPDSPFSVPTRLARAAAVQRQGDAARAAVAYRDGLAAAVRVLGPGHPVFPQARAEAADAYRRVGRCREATAALRPLAGAAPGTWTDRADVVRGLCLGEQGDAPGGAAVVANALGRLRRQLPPGDGPDARVGREWIRSAQQGLRRLRSRRGV